MTRLEMHQEFQLHCDKVDADSLPKIYPEEIDLFLNDSVLNLVLQARKELETTSQVSENFRSLVVDGEIQPNPRGMSCLYDLSKVRPVGITTGPYLNSLYFLMGHLRGSVRGMGGTVSLREVTHNEWEAILQNPHTKPRPSLCPFRYTQEGILVATPTILNPGVLLGTVLLYPATISPTQDCDLSPQLHRPVVLGAVELAQQSIQRGTQLTGGQA
ncbi:hypothetical protein Q5H92_14740 [Hymenobacter sp. M29]|uniref:IclR-ED domain-containing protein n=1 Tax=Hymenobacter mellowenesis TaxID=3063995 RepID=A0ABT9ADK1_9BACT|nr:hypothetical protein [Hymenobacter sp. M29]MDO7847623.1 hypothetical protein [Hymenobacter sp. M29]